MNPSQSSRAALKVVALWLILAAAGALYGCSAPATQTASPGATLQASDRELATTGCVCHFPPEQGAPPVSQLARFPNFIITQLVRRGVGVMPGWNTQNLSDQWLTRIINYLKSAPQATPSPAATPTP